MSEENKSPADGPGEAVIDEPTAHAMDPAKDPNTEWEAKAAEQIAEGESQEGQEDSDGSDGDPSEEDAGS